MTPVRLVIPLLFCVTKLVKPLPFSLRALVNPLPLCRQTTPVFCHLANRGFPANPLYIHGFHVSTSSPTLSPKRQRFVIKICKQTRAFALAGKNIEASQATAGAVAINNAARKRPIGKSIDKASTDVPDFASRIATRRPESLRRLAEPRQAASMRAPRRELSPATPELSTTPAERLLQFRGRGLMLRLATRCRTPLSTPEATPCSAYRPHAPLRRPRSRLCKHTSEASSRFA